MLSSQICCPPLTPVHSGSALSGAYAVQPAAAWPPSTKKPAIIKIPAEKAIQNDAILSRGNAMSGAPILSGIKKFPNTPTSSGMIAKNTMIVPCIVTSEL